MRTKFMHIRRREFNSNAISPRGGVTVAYIIDDNYRVIGYALAKCHEKDNYVKALGRAKAAGRLNSERHFEHCFNVSEEEFINTMMATQ